MRIFSLIFLFAFSSVANAEMYKVYVKRLDNNIYITTDKKVIIETKYCYEYAYGDEAILVYEPYSYDNKIIFVNSENSCEVKSVSA